MIEIHLFDPINLLIASAALIIFALMILYLVIKYPPKFA